MGVTPQPEEVMENLCKLFSTHPDRVSFFILFALSVNNSFLTCSVEIRHIWCIGDDGSDGGVGDGVYYIQFMPH